MKGGGLILKKVCIINSYQINDKLYQEEHVLKLVTFCLILKKFGANWCRSFQISVRDKLDIIPNFDEHFRLTYLRQINAFIKKHINNLFVFNKKYCY